MFKSLNKGISLPFAIGIIIIVVILVGGILAWKYFGISEETITPIELPEVSKGEVLITTDKTEYEQGEIIQITVKNNLDKPIWYIKEICPLSCCALHKLENNEWKSLGIPFPCIQFTYPGGSIEPYRLNSGEELKKQLDTKAQDEFAGGGKYRLSFYYGLNKDNYTEKTIYSNEFTIKEKLVLPSNNCDDYEMPMTEEETRECACPEGYQKFFRLSGAYCATDSQKPCRAQTDCPKDERCISHDGKNWFCTGAGAGCYYSNPENPEEQICVD